MMTLAPIRSATHAAAYFERGDHADYYLTDDVCPSVWLGTGAKLLGIKNQIVHPDRFKRFLAGEIAGQKIGTEREGKWQHKAGWDLQFSPSKSVSVAALVCGDQRVIEAHDNAVKEALKFLEKKAAFTRVHSRDEQGRDNCEQVPTNNLLAAVFRHDTSRALDAQLHSHAVVLNATLREDGKWRSLESRHFYMLQKEAGRTYRQCLAVSLRELGYTLERTADANFEIAGIPESLLDACSQRRDVIDKKLADLGFTRETAPAALKEKVAHESRKNKVRVEREQLIKSWQSLSEEHEFDSKIFTLSAIERSSVLTWAETIKVATRDKLEQLVKQEIHSLSERDAVFSKQSLEHNLNQLAVGYGISTSQVSVGIQWAEERGMLAGDRTIKSYSSQYSCWKMLQAYTTPESIIIENKMIESIRTGKLSARREFTQNAIESIIKEAELQSRALGFDGWTAGQKTAVRGVLSSNDRFLAIQGYAGTAKTTTALKTIAAEYEKRGYLVKGMAPSASACESLSHGANLREAVTVASHLLKFESKTLESQKQLWLVDEASLLSTKDMSKLLAQATHLQAKVLLVGDVKQLGSVDAGAAFRQLQENGLQTFELDEIVRQENENILASVYHSIDGEITEALESLSAGGGNIVEITGDSDSRHKQIAEQYMSLTPQERENTLVIDPSREGRDNLNQRLREGLRSVGELLPEEIHTSRLNRVDLTKAAAQDVLNYHKGDVVRFGRAYRSQNIRKHTYCNVSQVDANKGVIHLMTDNGRSIIWNPVVWGAKAQVFRPIDCGLSVGDKLTWLINDKQLGLTNGSKGMVKNIDLQNKTAEVEFSSGNKHTMSLNDQQAKHWNYSYASTVHASQGRTVDRVLCHAESFRRNLASQKALYVVISRAKHEAVIYTDNKTKLIEQVQEHVGEKQYANEQSNQLGYGINE